jgi:FAD/FMN-containing dehydrogenase
MNEVKETLRKLGFTGDFDDSPEAIEKFSHDASMFEIRPKLIIAPKTAKDVEIAVQYVAEHKKKNRNLSLTARSAGTDMSGGAINDSIIVDFGRYLNSIISVKKDLAVTQPGAFFRDFDKKTGNYLLPSYPASRDLATVGGMVNNNSGGEKSLQFGKTDKYVPELKFVFADGIERVVKPLTKVQLDKKIKQDDFEGKVYREMFELLEKNYDVIKAAKPTVSKDSTGYHIWNVWDRETGIFDLTKAIIGAQGTLGFTTEATFSLVPRPKHSGLLVLFMKNTDELGDLIKKVLEHKPATFESFDDATLWLSIKFMPSFLRLLGPVRFIHLLITLIPDGLQLLRGIPKLILMVEFTGETEEEVRRKVVALHKELSHRRARYEINGFEETPTEHASEKFWIMRRYSFQLLRSKVKDKHTAPFIDDLIVNPEFLPQFLPRIRKIIKKYKLFATVAGHMGDGNFHIIPLMNIERESERKKLLPAMREVNELVLKYNGSLSGEHNDGLVRGPWLEQMYGAEVVELFRKTKHIFDPQGIFNPHKKANADWDYSYSHIRKNFDDPKTLKR